MSAPAAQNENEGQLLLPTDEYTVGWVCALQIGMASAVAMLDEVHQNLVEQDQMDRNNYTLGRIQKHNVVIAGLPAGAHGTTRAAAVAKDMFRTFKSIRFGFMIGMGGGAPSPEHDIRLGDVVVSVPRGTAGGVIQYERGKTVKNGEFQRTGMLNAPPNILLTALGSLQAAHDYRDTLIPSYLSQMFTGYPKMKRQYSYPGASNDCLYQEECQSDPMEQAPRSAREDPTPEIHYGNIASGYQVIKDAKTRDKLRADLDVLCFEMGAAAALMSDFPCLAICGICDYADSHKNDTWKKYAAATAAAFAKELLSLISPLKARSTPQSMSGQLLVSSLQRVIRRFPLEIPDSGNFSTSLTTELKPALALAPITIY